MSTVPCGSSGAGGCCSSAFRRASRGACSRPPRTASSGSSLASAAWSAPIGSPAAVDDRRAETTGVLGLGRAHEAGERGLEPDRAHRRSRPPPRLGSPTGAVRARGTSAAIHASASGSSRANGDPVNAPRAEPVGGGEWTRRLRRRRGTGGRHRPCPDGASHQHELGDAAPAAIASSSACRSDDRCSSTPAARWLSSPRRASRPAVGLAADRP